MREIARMKKLDPNYEPPPEPEVVTDPEHQAEEAAAISVGQRCQAKVGQRRGEVKYVGKVEGIGKGYWVGVQYDEPVGKNDGSAKGKRYFECLPKYGGFIRPVNVDVGDFPERGLDDEDDDDDDEDDDAEENPSAPAAAEPAPPAWVERSLDKPSTEG